MCERVVQTWMLEVTGGSAAGAAQVMTTDFVQLYKDSALSRYAPPPTRTNVCDAFKCANSCQ